jgi:precorrin-6B methylase 2
MKINSKTRRTLVESLDNDNFKVAVEVGVRTGWFSKYILDHTKMKVYAIDPWENNMELSQAEKVYKECVERLSPYKDRCEMVKGYSPQISAEFKDGEADFIYLDGLHDYESVKKDINAWWTKIRDGGILAGHDYNKIKWKGVVNALEEFCEQQGVKFYLTGKVGNAFESRTGDLGEYDGDEHSWFIVKGKEEVEQNLTKIKFIET